MCAEQIPAADALFVADRGRRRARELGVSSLNSPGWGCDCFARQRKATSRAANCGGAISLHARQAHATSLQPTPRRAPTQVPGAQQSSHWPSMSTRQPRYTLSGALSSQSAANRAQVQSAGPHRHHSATRRHPQGQGARRQLCPPALRLVLHRRPVQALQR